MSSILSSHNLSYQAIAQFLRGYQSTLPISIREWAQAESMGLPVGTLVLCLDLADNVTADGAQSGGAEFQLQELGLVVGVDNERPIVVCMNADRYELVFLEELMARRADAASAAGTDFYYVLAESRRPLSEITTHEIEQIGYGSARGGLRKDRKSDGTGICDPAITLLTTLGLQMDPSGFRQPLDLAAFTFMLLENAPTDPKIPFTQVKESFRALSINATAEDIVNEEPAYEQPAMLPTEVPASEPLTPQQTEQLQGDLKMLLGLGGIFSTIADNNPDRVDPAPELPTAQAPSAPPADPSARSAPPVMKIKMTRSGETAAADKASPVRGLPKGPPPAMPRSRSTADSPASGPAESPPAAPTQPAADLSFPDLSAIEAAAREATVDRPEPPIVESKPESPVVESKPEPAVNVVEPTPTAAPLREPLKPPSVPAAPEPKAPEPAVASTQKAQEKPPVEERPAAKASPFLSLKSPTAAKKEIPPPKPAAEIDEPPMVASGMESLVAKLEQQVSRAASKLSSQIDDVRSRLESELEGLVGDASQSWSRNESELARTLEKIFKQLEDVAEDARLKLADSSATGRYAIKQLTESNQNSIDDRQSTLMGGLVDSCKELRKNTNKLTQSAESRLAELIDQKSAEIKELLEAVCTQLEETSSDHISRLRSKFQRLKDRLKDQASGIDQGFEQHVTSLNEDLVMVCERASEKLMSSKDDFELAMQQAVMIWELELSRIIKSLNSTVLAPRLRERKSLLKKTVTDLERRYADESAERASGHSSDITSRISELKQKVQQTLGQAQGRIEESGRKLQDELAEAFQTSSQHIEKAESDALEKFNDTESKINDSDSISRNMVEASANETDPSLMKTREDTQEFLHKLKQSTTEKLATSIEDSCRHLQEKSEDEHTKLTTSREEQLKSVKDSVQEALSSIKDGIRESFEAIQMIREKYLE